MVYIGMFLIGVMLLGFLVIIHQSASTLTAYQQFYLLVGGSMLLVMGMDSVRLPRMPQKNADFLPLALITMLAFGLRVIDLEHNIPKFVDEIHSISALIRLWERPEELILLPHGTVTAFPWLYPLLQNLTVNLFGVTFTGLRVMSAIFGTLTIIALWLLARELFNRRIAFLAALMLATFPPHLHFSRLAINNIADPLFGTLALFFLVRALRCGWGFALAGVLLGFTQYFYEGGRLLYPPLIGGGLIIWLVLERPAARSVSWWGVGKFWAAFLLVTLPLYVTWHVWDFRFTPRLDDMLFPEYRDSGLANSSLLQMASTAVERFVMALWTYTQRPPADWFYSGTTGLVITPVLPLFLAGCWFAVWRMRISKFHWQPGAILLLLWLLATAAGNSLLVNTSETARYVVVFPAVALIVAVGVWSLLAVFIPDSGAPYRPGQSPAPLILALMCVGMLLAVVQVGYYFGIHVKDYNQQFAETAGYDDVLWRFRELPPYTHVHLVIDHTEHLDDYNILNLIYFHRRQHDIQYSFAAPDDLSFDYLQSLTPQVHHAFFVRPVDTSALQFMDICCWRFGPVYSTRRVDQSHQYAMYLIPAMYLPEEGDQPPSRQPSNTRRTLVWIGLCAVIVGAVWISVRL